MRIRRGTHVDLLRLRWAWPSSSATQAAFAPGHCSADVGDRPQVDKLFAGELHIFWDSVDKDEAVGRKRAYLCAFGVHPGHKRQGIGGALLTRALQRIVENGFTEADYRSRAGPTRFEKDVSGLGAFDSGEGQECG